MWSRTSKETGSEKVSSTLATMRCLTEDESGSLWNGRAILRLGSCMPNLTHIVSRGGKERPARVGQKVEIRISVSREPMSGGALANISIMLEGYGCNGRAHAMAVGRL